jgi:ribosome biogenesis GTPase
LSSAVVCRATRRHVDVYSEDFTHLRGKLTDTCEAVCVGDAVTIADESTGMECLVTERLPRTNLLQRSSSAKTKLLAANIDQLFIVTAPGPICKVQTIDRVLVAAAHAGIATQFIWNKNDITEFKTETEQVQSAYRSAGYQIQLTSTVSGTGVAEIVELFSNSSWKHVVLTGVSGVGKSSLLNCILGSEMARTQQISERSGYGKQTTSEAFGYLMPRPGREPLMICDLPGVQQFGLAHLSEPDLRQGYPEFSHPEARCRFANCTHIEEPECSIRELVDAGKISAQRFSSYSQIVNEHRLMHY